MDAAELERFAGAYTAEGGGFRALFEVTDEGLVATLGEDTMKMVPLGSLRFKIAGDPPGDYFGFLEEEGKIVAFEVIRAGAAQLKLVKE